MNKQTKTIALVLIPALAVMAGLAWSSVIDKSHEEQVARLLEENNKLIESLGKAYNELEPQRQKLQEQEELARKSKDEIMKRQADLKRQADVLREANRSLTGEKSISILPQAKAEELPKTTTEKPFDLDKLALAVGKHETGNCTLGYGKMYNNCVGMKMGNTAPCPVKNGVRQIGRNNMCIYGDPQQSYDAFKIVWSKWYGGLPDAEKAKRYSGNDRSNIWLKNVLHFYHS